MKVNELVKKIEVSIEIPKFEKYTDTESVSEELTKISEAKSKIEFVKNSIPILERFCISIGYHSRSFVINVYSTYILFSFNREWVIGNIPITVTSNDVNVNALQRDKWEQMSGKECVSFAIDCYIHYLEELEAKFENWLEFLESEIDNIQ